MNEQNTKKICDDFPRLYLDFDGFECGDEYFDVLYQLSSALCELAMKEDYEPENLCFDEGHGIYPTVSQVKMKYGSLRFYAYALTSEMRALIDRSVG